MNKIITLVFALFTFIGISKADGIGYATNVYPEDMATNISVDSLTLSWELDENTTEWRLVFGTTYYLDQTHPQTIVTDWSNEPSNSYMVYELFHNTNYFWRIDQRNDDTLLEGTVWGFTTSLNVPLDLNVDNSQVLNGDTINLTWTPVVDRTFRTYYVYRNGIKIGETEQHNINVGSYTDGPLAYSSEPYEYYVTVIYDEGESGPSNVVNVQVSGIANIEGFVYETDGETGIANATVTMIGENEFGESQEYTFVTDSTGYYNGEVYVGEYNGSSDCDGYIAVDEPIIGNPFNVAYPSIENVNYILIEELHGPCSVVAEYMETNDNYVQVYWDMCGYGEGLNHYKIYRTDCANEGPYTEENTILLADSYEDVPTYVDVNWPYASIGEYKWGVAAVYNEREFIEPFESEIIWSNCLEKTEEEICLPGAPLNIAVDDEFDRVVIWWEQTIEVVKYNVYRSVDNVEYELVDEVSYHETPEPYEWYEEPGTGYYYYKITAVYEDCESESAVDMLNPENDYVTVTVTNVSENQNVNIYPNPVHNYLTIEQDGIKNICIFNVTGQKIYEICTSDNVVNIDMSNYLNGMYVVRINNNNYKIVK